MRAVDLGLSQIFPILDPQTDEELQVAHSAFCDPHLLIIRSDSSAQVLKIDASGDLDELDPGEALLARGWLSGCIYKSTHTADQALAFLLSETGALHVSLQPCLTTFLY